MTPTRNRGKMCYGQTDDFGIKKFYILYRLLYINITLNISVLYYCLHMSNAKVVFYIWGKNKLSVKHPL